MPGFARPLNKRGAIGPKPAAARWLDRQSWFGSEPATPDSEAAQPWSFLQRAWPSPARRWPAPVQAKLVVGQVDDPQEKEADRVAEAVLRLPATAAPPDAHPSPPDGSPHASPGAPPSTHTVQRAPAPGTATPPSSAHTPATALAVSKPTDAAEREADAVAAQLPQGAPGSEPDSNRTSAGPLPAHDRAFFESRFGHELSRVRVHTDHAAAAAASSIGAEAFTVGTDIAFADGRYRPGTDDGRRLLAHELTHVVQQGGASPLPNSPRMAIARSPAVVARKPAPASTPAPAATPEPTQEADEPVDKYKGLAVSKVIVSLGRGRVGFQTPLGMLMGGIGTDLKPGKYTLTPLPALKIWKVEGPNVKSGLRFDLTLDDADPWTLSYPDKLPLVVTAGSETDPATIEDMIDPTTGELKDPLALFEGMPMQEPVSGIDDFEDARYDPDYKTVQKNFSKFLIVHYRDNTRRDINIDDIKPDTPRLFAMKQEVLVIMDEYLFMQILVSFPAVFFVLTMMPFATSPTAGARPRYVVSRQVFSKSSGARLSGEPGTAPGQLKSRAPAEPPAPAEAPKAPVEPSKAPAEPPKAPAEAPKAETEPSKVPAESPQTQANPATRAPGNIVAQKIADPNATVGSGTRWSGKGPEPQWKNPKSTKAYDHIESTHGPKKNQKDFEGRLASTGDPQGQWYDANDWVVAENAAPKQPGTYIIDFGRPVGRVFAQKGSPPIENVTRAFVQRNPDGTLNSAYPVTDSFTLK